MGCFDPSIPVPPATQSYIYNQLTDTPFANIANGDQNGKLFYVDWNKLAFVLPGDLNLGSGGDTYYLSPDGNIYSLNILSDQNVFQIDLNTIGNIKADGNLYVGGFDTGLTRIDGSTMGFITSSNLSWAMSGGGLIPFLDGMSNLGSVSSGLDSVFMSDAYSSNVPSENGQFSFDKDTNQFKFMEGTTIRTLGGSGADTNCEVTNSCSTVFYLDQSSPQTIINGAPTFQNGAHLDYDNGYHLWFLNGASNGYLNFNNSQFEFSDNMGNGYPIFTSGLNDSMNYLSVDPVNRLLMYSDGLTTAFDWENGNYNDSSSATSANLGGRTLHDSSGTMSVDWANRILYNANPMGGDAELDFSGDGVSFNHGIIDWSSRVMSIDPNFRTLYATDGTTPVMNWEYGYLYDYITNTTSIDFVGRLLYDSIGVMSVDWTNRILYAEDGITEMLEYTSGGVQISNAYLLPTTDGSDGQVMTTDGAGNIAWEDGGNGSSQDLNTTMGLGNWTNYDLNINKKSIVDVNVIWFDGNKDIGILTCPDGNIFMGFVRNKVC